MRGVRRWIAETVGGLPRTYWFLWTNLLINRLGAFVLIFLAYYLTEVRGLAPAFAGFVIGLWGAGGAVGTMVGGVLADRWGRKKTFLTGLYLSAALMLTLGFMRTPVTIAITVLALGLTTESARPAMSALMVDIVPAADRVRAFSLTYWVVNLGFSFAAVTAGFVANVDFLLLFVIDAATTVAAATVVLVTVREPARAAPPRASADPGRAPSKSTVDKPGLRQVFADRVFLTFVGINVLTAVVFMQHISTLPISMSRDGLPASTFGTVIALNGILIVAGQLFVGRMLRAAPRARSLAIAAIILGFGFGLAAFADSAWLYAVSVLIWTIGEMVNAPSSSATIAELSPATMRGRYQGVFSLSWSIASFCAPIIGATVLQYLGKPALWLGCFGVLVVAAGLHLLAAGPRERRAAELRVPDPSTEDTPTAAVPSPRSARPRTRTTPAGPTPTASGAARASAPSAGRTPPGTARPDRPATSRIPTTAAPKPGPAPAPTANGRKTGSTAKKAVPGATAAKVTPAPDQRGRAAAPNGRGNPTAATGRPAGKAAATTAGKSAKETATGATAKATGRAGSAAAPTTGSRSARPAQPARRRRKGRRR